MTEFCALSHADADLWERRYGAHPSNRALARAERLS